MRPFFLVFVFLICCQGLKAQQVKQKIEPRQGLLQLTPTIKVPYEDAGYTLVLPADETARGLIVFFNSDRDTINKIFHHALPLDIAVAYVTTGNRFEFFFEEESMQQIESYLQEIISQYKIPKQNLLFCGMSLAGTRALKQAIFAQQSSSRFQLAPRAIAACDSPIDFVRFWQALERAKRLNYNSIAVNEATWVTAYLEKNLNGTPKNQEDQYIDYSPYSFSNLESGNEQHLKGVAVRAYTEPDVEWWMKNRGKSYYGMNALDAAALINALQLLGNEEADLILTNDKGYRPNGTRHPHSWSIVDEKELVEWFIQLLE
ncbi:MAG: hypothetical protein KTR30_08680 [Saprospiraceae bacterium]|nr:hypothetical protein [Saprospiraceae bacterium]